MMYCIPAVPSLALSFSTFLPVSVCPFLPQLPYLKNTETKPKKEETQQSPVFLPLLFIISFSFSLSSTNKFVSPYLSTSPSLFLTHFYQPALFILSSHCSLSLFLILPFSLYFPTTDTLSLKTGGLAVHSPRPNTYTHPSDQYFFSCCSPLSYFTPPPTSPPPFVLPSPPPPCGLLLHTVSRSVHPKSYAPNIYSTFHSYSLHSSLLWLLPIFHSSSPSFSSLLSFFIQKTDQGQRISRL